MNTLLVNFFFKGERVNILSFADKRSLLFILNPTVAEHSHRHTVSPGAEFCAALSLWNILGLPKEASASHKRLPFLTALITILLWGEAFYFFWFKFILYTHTHTHIIAEYLDDIKNC